MDKSGKKIGVALSGGGYRAAAYHIGTLRALDRLGILDHVDVISSVSGGSITSAYYALNKEKYSGDFAAFEESFARKLQRGVLWSSVLNLLLIVALMALSVYLVGWWVLIPELIVLFFFSYKLLNFSFWIKRAYDRLFFKGAKLSHFPETPLIAINSTNIATGTLFTFSQKKIRGHYIDPNEKDGDRRKLQEIGFEEHGDFPVCDAVMASSCVPFAFSPIRIKKKYHKKHPVYRIERPLLVDGGLYDNQGAHKLSNKDSDYHTPIVIVSDAGAGVMNARWAFNIPLMLMKTSNIMMHRIKTFQMEDNIYTGVERGRRYAYLSLGWNVSEVPLVGFVDHVVEGHVAPELYTHHGISQEDAESLRKVHKGRRKRWDIDCELYEKIISQLKQNIGWEELQRIKPSKKVHELARNVGTNLTALKKSQIEALAAHSNWLTEVQVRLYLPHLIAR